MSNLIGRLVACVVVVYGAVGCADRARLAHGTCVPVGPPEITVCCDPEIVGKIILAPLAEVVAEAELSYDGRGIILSYQGEPVASQRIRIRGREISTIQVFALDCAPAEYTIEFRIRGRASTEKGFVNFQDKPTSVRVRVHCPQDDPDPEPDPDIAAFYANMSTQIYGQPDGVSGLPNQGGDTAADTLNAPLGSVGIVQESTTQVIYAADSSNNRVAGYVVGDSSDGPPADFVIGQPDFTSNAAGLSANQFTSPVSVDIEASQIFIVDGNHRVLIYNGFFNIIPDVVVGQPHMGAGTPDAGPAGMRAPSDVSVGGGRMAVAEAGNNRVGLHDAIPTTNGASADRFLGQADANGTSPGSGHADLNGPCGVWTDGNAVVVSDTQNDCVKIWLTWPTRSGQEPDVVIRGDSPRNGLNKPKGVDSDGERLVIADSEFHRVVELREFLTRDDLASLSRWDFVYGQSSLTNTAPNDDDQDGVEDAQPSRRTFNRPQGVRLNVVGKLFVSDTGNHRALKIERIDDRLPAR